MSSSVTSATIIAVIAVTLLASAAGGQTPQPFPRPGAQTQTPVSPQTPAGSPPRPVAQAADPNNPTAESLGFPIYPSAQFLASYDAGRGQRYYLFGTTASFAEAVAFYRTQLDERGNLVYKEPGTHMFEVGRFRDEAMAFPPGVTVKDWTWGGSQGYPNPKPGGQPARFATVIMIVPAPAAVPAR